MFVTFKKTTTGLTNGSSYRDLGQAEEAIGFYQQALALFQHIGVAAQIKEVQGFLEELREAECYRITYSVTKFFAADRAGQLPARIYNPCPV